MLVRPATKLYACLTDDGAVIADSVLTEPEFNNTVHRHTVEGIALATSGCSRVRWEDVTDNEDCWLDDGNENFVLTERGIDFLQSMSIA